MITSQIDMRLIQILRVHRFWGMLISDTIKMLAYATEGDEPQLSQIYNNVINNLLES